VRDSSLFNSIGEPHHALEPPASLPHWSPLPGSSPLRPSAHLKFRLPHLRPGLPHPGSGHMSQVAHRSSTSTFATATRTQAPGNVEKTSHPAGLPPRRQHSYRLTPGLFGRPTRYQIAPMATSSKPAGIAMSITSATSRNKIAAAISARPKMIRFLGTSDPLPRIQPFWCPTSVSPPSCLASGSNTHQARGMTSGASGRKSRTSLTIATR